MHMPMDQDRRNKEKRRLYCLLFWRHLSEAQKTGIPSCIWGMPVWPWANHLISLCRISKTWDCCFSTYTYGKLWLFPQLLGDGKNKACMRTWKGDFKRSLKFAVMERQWVLYAWLPREPLKFSSYVGGSINASLFLLCLQSSKQALTIHWVMAKCVSELQSPYSKWPFYT